MADTKISALAAASALAGTEPLPLVQSGVTVKATVAQIATAVEALIAPARVPWESAGGAVPTLGGVYPLDTPGVAVTLGTSPNRLTAWQQIGKECFATCRIKSGGSPASGEGYMTLVGLPVAPKYVGSGNDGGQIVGTGMLFDLNNGGRFYPLRVVIDPAYSLTLPIFFYGGKVVTAADPDGLNSAVTTGIVSTDTPQVVDTKNVWGPRSFGGGTILPIVHGAGTYPTYGALAVDPFDFSTGFILNMTLQYEGV